MALVPSTTSPMTSLTGMFHWSKISSKREGMSPTRFHLLTRKWGCHWDLFVGEGDLILTQGRAQCTQWKMRPKAMNFLELKGQKQILYFSSSSCNAYNFVFHKMISSKSNVTLDLHSQVKFRERRRPAQPTMSPHVKLAKQSLEDAYAGYTLEIKVSKPLVIALRKYWVFWKRDFKTFF